MSETNEQNKETRNGLFEEFLEAKNELASELATTMEAFFEQDKRPETEFVGIYMDSFKNAVKSAGNEINIQFQNTDNETASLIETHVKNTGAIQLFRSTSAMLKKRSGVLGFLEKIVPILEIVKKLLTHITELFPNFLERILKKIIIPIMELIDNIFQKVLDLFGNKAAPAYLRNAEDHFLDVHPKWRAMLFDTVRMEETD